MAESDDELSRFIETTLGGGVKGSMLDERQRLRRKLLRPLLPRIRALRELAAAKIGASHWRNLRRFIRRELRPEYLEILEGEVMESAATRPRELAAWRYRTEAYGLRLSQAIDRFVERAWWGDLPAAVEAWGRANHYGALLSGVDYENVGRAEKRGAEERLRGATAGGLSSRKLTTQECDAAIREEINKHPGSLIKEIVGAVMDRFGVDRTTVMRNMSAEAKQELRANRSRR